MPLGIGVGQLVGLVREARALESSDPWIAVSGPDAAELATTLSIGGDPRAVRVDGDPLAASVAIRIVEGDPSAAEIAVLRRLAREGSAVLVVRRSGGPHLAHVLPEDVIEAGPDLPLEELLTGIARIASQSAPSLAARLPLLRPAVARRLVRRTALTNAAIAASSDAKGAQLPALVLAQSRMALRLGLTRGQVLPSDPQQLLITVGPALASALAVGVAARTLVRRLPTRGPLIRAAVAYAGTEALGAARRRI